MKCFSLVPNTDDFFWNSTQITIKPINSNIKSEFRHLKMSSTEDTLIFSNVVSRKFGYFCIIFQGYLYDETNKYRQIFRHGDRNVAMTYPNDPYKDSSHWPEGFFELTKVHFSILLFLTSDFSNIFRSLISFFWLFICQQILSKF